MDTSVICTRDLLLRSLRDHDTAAKNNMRIATQHLKRGYEIARQLEQFERSEDSNDISRDHANAEHAA
jgi:hypothetical protein